MTTTTIRARRPRIRAEAIATTTIRLRVARTAGVATTVVTVGVVEGAGGAVARVLGRARATIRAAETDQVDLDGAARAGTPGAIRTAMDPGGGADRDPAATQVGTIRAEAASVEVGAGATEIRTAEAAAAMARRTQGWIRAETVRTAACQALRAHPTIPRGERRRTPG